jgi:hypothetical protein
MSEEPGTLTRTDQRQLRTFTNVGEELPYSDVIVQNRQPAPEGSRRRGRYASYAEVPIRRVRSVRQRRVYRVANFGGDQEHAERLAARLAYQIRNGEEPEVEATGPER